MRKVFLIGWKDLTLTFRDRAALVLMLAAPFALTLGLGFITGRFSGSSNSGVNEIPVVLVNQDEGQLGKGLVDLFRSPDLAVLVTPAVLDDPAAARRQVDQDQAAAAIIIPAGFTRSLIPAAASIPSDKVIPLELYTNPTRPTSVGILKTILEEYMSRVEVGRVAGQVVVTQLLSHGLIQAQDAARIGSEVGASQAQAAQDNPAITVKAVTASGQTVQFDPLAYMAPGMALMFLMFTVSNGGRTLLAERAQGTLPRLLVTPTSGFQILGGKIFGIFLSGSAQMIILIGASTLLFRLDWGDPLGVLVLVLAAVIGALGWGLLITALARTPGQVNAIGSALMLIFGILGGSFISLDQMPAWFQVISKITPNSWGLDGFTTLAMGGQLADILLPVGALLIMGVILFSAAALLYNRGGLIQS
ncbi:MAG TPA: ABC transporter permease [Anaerolineales bacterium]